MFTSTAREKNDFSFYSSGHLSAPHSQNLNHSRNLADTGIYEIQLPAIIPWSQESTEGAGSDASTNK